MSREFQALSFCEQTMWLRAETLRGFAAWMRDEGSYPVGSISEAREWLPEYEGKRVHGYPDPLAWTLGDMYGNI